MPEMILKRRWLTDRSTIGELRFGEFSCFTLEDRLRDAGVKIPGATAIPAGRYRVVVDWSNRFQRRMPLLLEVPKFTGIRIHSGNTDADIKGCILVGQSRAPDWVGGSRAAFRALFPLLDGASEAVWLTITDEPLVDSRAERTT